MAAKRGKKRGFRSIRKLPSGRYQARYTGPTGEVVRALKTYTAAIDAEAWLVGERKVLEGPEPWTTPQAREDLRKAAQDRVPSLREYAEQWIDNRRNSRGEPLRPLTIAKYRSSLRIHVYPTLGDFPLDQITRAAIRSWYDNLDVGHTARSHAFVTLKTILNTAVTEDELLAKNPATIRGASARGSRTNLRPATLDELAVMVEAMPERRRLLVLLACWCALRSGELRELRRADIILGVDAKTGEPFGRVSVSRAVVVASTGTPDGNRRTRVIVGPPKTDAGVRTVSIPAFLLPVVRAHLEQHTAAGDDGLLFPSDRDPLVHLSESTMNGRPAKHNADGEIVKAGFGWREARRLAGREDLPLHGLRHTGASMAGEAGASLSELMHRLGHSTVGTALLYQHATRDRDHALGERLSAMAKPDDNTDR